MFVSVEPTPGGGEPRLNLQLTLPRLGAAGAGAAAAMTCYFVRDPAKFISHDNIEVRRFHLGAVPALKLLPHFFGLFTLPRLTFFRSWM